MFHRNCLAGCLCAWQNIHLHQFDCYSLCPNLNRIDSDGTQSQETLPVNLLHFHLSSSSIFTLVFVVFLALQGGWHDVVLKKKKKKVSRSVK